MYGEQASETYWVAVGAGVLACLTAMTFRSVPTAVTTDH